MMNDLQLPPAFTAMLGMGAPKAYFPAKKITRVGSLIAFFVFLGGSVVVFLYGLYDTYLAYQQHGPAMIGDRLATPAIAALVLFLLALAGGWSAYVNWNKGVAVYDKGFVYRDRKGFQPWRWEEVVSLTVAVTRHYTNGIYTGTTHIYTLFNHRNERLVLGDILKGIEQLAAAIEQAIFPNLYEHASTQYNAGQALVFGPLMVSKAGIQIGKRTYPWVEVEQVSIKQGMLKISKKSGGWFSGASVPAASIPNLRVVLSIIDQVVGVKAK